MQYEDFKKVMMAEFTERTGSLNMEILEQKMNKVNQELDAVVFHQQGRLAAPQVYLNNLYQDYENGKGISEIAGDTLDLVRDTINRTLELPTMSRDFITENIYLTVMSKALNKDYLSNIPYEDLEDMAVVARVHVTENGREESSFVVTDDVISEFGFDKAELFEAAHANMEQQEYRCQTLNEMLAGFGLPTGPEAEVSNTIYVLTNQSGIDGASAIIADKAMNQAREKIGEDFFILPSSRHEVILVPRSAPFSVAELTDMVTQANRTVVEQRDLLSDHVYRYNSQAGTIRLLEESEKTFVKENKQEMAHYK